MPDAHINVFYKFVLISLNRLLRQHIILSKNILIGRDIILVIHFFTGNVIFSL